jgi:ABC-2 type transport system permease protein
MALANPVRRVAIAVGRALGILVALFVVNAVAHIVLAAYAPAVGLDEGLPTGAFGWAAAVGLAFVLLHVAVTFAVGAATGRKGWAIGAGAGLALVGFLVNAMASVAEVFEKARDYSPWYWMLKENLLTTAPGLLSLWLPLGLSVLLVAVGTWAFNRRDLAG